MSTICLRDDWRNGSTCQNDERLTQKDRGGWGGAGSQATPLIFDIDLIFRADFKNTLKDPVR